MKIQRAPRRPAAHPLLAIAAALVMSACASAEYYDTNAAVDARAECSGMASERTGEPVPGWCEREQGARWSSGSNEQSDLDFSGRGDDDR